MAGNTLAVAHNPTCEAKCPEHCSQPWKKFVFQHVGRWNISEKYLFGLPIPQPITDNWIIAESLKIVGDLIS